MKKFILIMLFATTSCATITKKDNCQFLHHECREDCRSMIDDKMTPNFKVNWMNICVPKCADEHECWKRR